MSVNTTSRREVLQRMTMLSLVGGLSGTASLAMPQSTAAEVQLPDDVRLGPLKDLDGYFPFAPAKTPEQWQQRKEYVKRQMLVACGLWPMPSRPAIQATVHGVVERDDYTVERVLFESSPGLLVTGSLYRPKGVEGPLPTILTPHGHWANGRFHDHGEGQLKQELDSDAEVFETGGRHPLQMRCAQLARMGCMVFLYDMLGYADGSSISYDLAHRFAKQRPHMSAMNHWGLFSAQSELRLLNALGLQTWNSIRTLDWITSRQDCDTGRIGVTGASGGGTQTFMLAALDERIAAAFPAVMVSTAMQGGCTCENASLLRVNTGNIEFAAMVAPRPIFMSGANDWTVEIETKGLPELKQHFTMLGVPERVDAKHFDYPHNYNRHSRAMMYDFFNRHLNLGVDQIVERDIQPLTVEEATVFNDQHPAPAKDEATEMRLLTALDDDLAAKISDLTPKDRASLGEYRRVVGGGWEIMIGRGLPDSAKVDAVHVSDSENGSLRISSGRLRHDEVGEEVPFTTVTKADSSGKDVVIWVSGNGRSSLFDDNHNPAAPVSTLLDAGCSVTGIDLLYTGDFLQDGKPLTETRTVQNPREFLGYTLGYNHSLFAQRVHDVMKAIAWHRKGSSARRIHVIGIEGAAAIAAAAVALSSQAVSSLGVDLDGFRFESITSIRDVNLIPGGVRYGDVAGLLALCSPASLAVARDQLASVTQAAYSSAKGTAVELTATDSASAAKALANWTVRQIS